MQNITLSGKFLGGSGDKSFEPQRSNSGVIYIPYTGKGTEGDDKVNGMDVTEFLALATESFRLPAVSTETIQVGWFNENVNIAGKQIVDDVDFVIKDFVDIPVAEYLERWFAQVYNASNGAVGMAKDFKKDVFMILYAQDGNPEYTRWYKLEGCFINRIARGDIDQNNSDIVRMTVTLSVDRVIPNILKDKAYSAVPLTTSIA
jgi:hypothetical protein